MRTEATELPGASKRRAKSSPLPSAFGIFTRLSAAKAVGSGGGAGVALAFIFALAASVFFAAALAPLPAAAGVAGLRREVPAGLIRPEGCRASVAARPCCHNW